MLPDLDGFVIKQPTKVYMPLNQEKVKKLVKIDECIVMIIPYLQLMY